MMCRMIAMEEEDMIMEAAYLARCKNVCYDNIMITSVSPLTPILGSN